MAYCNNCGAYIPDGQTKCLACGFDEAAQQAAAAAAAASAGSEAKDTGRFDSDFLRRQLEQQTKRQRENSRKWAEAERARRQSQQQSENSRKWAESERAKRQSQQEQQTRQSAAAAAQSGTADDGAAAAPNKVLAALSYLGILCFLPMFLCPNDDFAMFHARQGLGLLIVGVGANILSAIIGLNWLVTLLWVYMIYMGMTAASAGKRKLLPYIGSLFLKK